MKVCESCFYHCHYDGRCYADPRSAYDEDYALKVVNVENCTKWVFDGLQDWERENKDALVTVDCAA